MKWVMAAGDDLDRPVASSPGHVDRTRTLVLAALAILGVLLAGYILWLTFSRPEFRYSIVWDGWLPDGFQLLVAGLCIARGFVRQPGRGVAVALGCGLLAWGLGDTVSTAQAVVGTSSATNILRTVFWLGFYPFAYIALVLFMKKSFRLLSTPNWLDGAVAALGTGAVCAAFAFHGIARSFSGNALTTATNLAYPIGDLLLLGLAVGGAAMLSGRRTVPWLVLATGCLVNCVGDTFNIFQSGSQSRANAVFYVLAWPVAGLLMTVAMWLRPRPASLFTRPRSSGFLLPGLATASGLAVLVAGSVYYVGGIALALAVASLIAAGVRLVWSAQRLRALTEQRYRQSMTDELTGLGNRRYLFDNLNVFFRDQADMHAERRPLIFLFVDLNHFKEVNDSFGHLAGDELLKQLGPRLSRSLRSSDVLVRFGGDEFGVVLMDTDADYATSLAQQLTSELEEPFDLDGVSVSISASIGIASAPADANDIGGLLECADVAMYRSKLERCPFAFFDGRLDVANQWRLGDELRVAIEQRQLVLHYQPQVSPRTGEMLAVEALVRWQHPKLGLLEPSRFLPLAEQAGLMPSLTAMLIDDALAQSARWRDAGDDICVSVNISANNLLDGGFTNLVKRLTERHRCPAGSLVLEITETSIIEHFEQSKLVIEELADVGVVLSIDDFGAGATSLSYLSSLAVGELKLDRMLITDLAASSRGRDRELVRSTIQLGHALGLRVVAEGIEDEATLDLLRDLKCDLAQGYFIGRPIPADKLAFRPRVLTTTSSRFTERSGGSLAGVGAANTR